VVNFCLKHNIFPSVGELEDAGNIKQKDTHDLLWLTKEELVEIREKSGLAEIEYMRPICPAILFGLHIDNKGNCIADTITGLNCKWFLLENPQTTSLGNIQENTIEDLHNRVLEYKKTCLCENRKTIDSYEDINYVFGGCGGNPSDIIKLYKESEGIL
jgi:hypothetical protein